MQILQKDDFMACGLEQKERLETLAEVELCVQRLH